MNFRTEINIYPNKWLISHNDNIVTFGSCFAENISKYLINNRFNILENPFGVLYNPVSIYNAVKLLSEKRQFTKDDLFFDQEEYHSFYHHSDFSHHSSETCLERINRGIVTTREFLEKTNIVILTFGTAFVYKHIENEIIVSNCHKIPAKKFDRFCLNLQETKEYIELTINLLKDINPEIKIILTVSPVRHWKDGAAENQISKAILLLSMHEIIDQEENLDYFPSYELVIDDLRDYRFYKEDMLHPNDLAIKYIWGKFSNRYFSEECKQINNFTSKISSARAHKPRNPKSPKHQKFLRSQINFIDDLEKQYPHLNLEQDKDFFQSLIIE